MGLFEKLTKIEASLPAWIIEQLKREEQRRKREDLPTLPLYDQQLPPLSEPSQDEEEQEPVIIDIYNNDKDIVYIR